MSKELIEKMDIFGSIQGFEAGQRMAMMLTKSNLIPKSFQGQTGDCLIALNIANRIGADPIFVMQNLVIIHGRPSWSSQFIIAAINTCGKFSPLRFKFNKDKSSCRAYAIELETKEELEGTEITLEMAKREGWSTKSGSKWVTMPEQMLRYRAASFFGRIYAPEILMGMRAVEENEEIGVNNTEDIKEQMASESFDIEIETETEKETVIDLREEALKLDPKTKPESNIEMDF